jgi:hypothetical protein
VEPIHGLVVVRSSGGGTKEFVEWKKRFPLKDSSSSYSYYRAGCVLLQELNHSLPIAVFICAMQQCTALLGRMKVVGLASLPSKGIQEKPRGKGKTKEQHSAQWEWKKSPSVNRAHESSNSIVNTIRNHADAAVTRLSRRR